MSNTKASQDGLARDDTKLTRCAAFTTSNPIGNFKISIHDGAMKVQGKAQRTIWLNTDGWSVGIIDQTKFPHRFETVTLSSMADAAQAIKDMLVRGAPLIGATAAYGMALAMREDASDNHMKRAYDVLHETRPTAINLRWALDEMTRHLSPLSPQQRVAAAYQRAAEIVEEDVEINRSIGGHGLGLVQAIAAKKKSGERVNVLTHCNAGWLATVDWGTATAPIYMAHDAGIPIHVWVDETRPRNQGASLTSWELAQHGVPYTLIPDNTGGHLMQHGQVDLCIVGTDRTTADGDVCNKIGTYLKALAAHDNGVPFYVALPSPTIDFRVRDGVKEIPIEQRSGDEVSLMTGLTKDGRIETVEIAAKGTPVANYAFDVTPSRLVTGLITERGVIAANRDAIAAAFPERAKL
jgi:methylthioribose-1-phosphate isomerase